MTENDISYIIRGIIFKIENELGPGLLESVYEEILDFELKHAGLKVERQKSIPVIWNGKKLDHGFRADLIVEEKVIIEIKSVDAIAKVHFKQVQTYLKLTDAKLGLLINFNESPVLIKRIVNNL